MKKLLLFLPFLLFGFLSNAQVPQKMSYQAVVRNASNTLVINAPVGMQISILQGSASGTPVYVETQNPTTNDNGLVSIEIGNGNVVSGSFVTIDWATGPYFIKTEIDPAGGNNYSIVGTSQLLSVPYAMYAETSGNSTTYLPGNGITISNDSIINVAPDQIVNINGTGQTNVSGVYPNFNINTPPYTSGTGISINGQVVNALNSNPIWNAEKLQGDPIDTITPNLGDILEFDGNKWKQSDKLPQMTTAQREALTNLFPGMMILNINTDCIEYYTGAQWLGLCGETGNIGNSLFGGAMQGGNVVLISENTSATGGAEYLFTLNNKAYFKVPIGATDTFWEWDPSNNTWSQKTTPPFWATQFFIGDIGYFMKYEFNGSVITITTTSYNPSNNLWSAITNVTYANLSYTNEFYFVCSDNQNAWFWFQNIPTIYSLYKYNSLLDSLTLETNGTISFQPGSGSLHSFVVPTANKFLYSTSSGLIEFDKQNLSLSIINSNIKNTRLLLKNNKINLFKTYINESNLFPPNGIVKAVYNYQYNSIVQGFPVIDTMFWSTMFVINNHLYSVVGNKIYEIF